MNDSLNETEQIIKKRALTYAEQHAMASTGLVIGGNDLMTVSGFIKNIGRMIFLYDTKGKNYIDKSHESHEHLHYHDKNVYLHPIKYFADDNSYIEQVNAFYFGDMIQVSNGQKQALKYFSEKFFPSDDII